MTMRFERDRTWLARESLHDRSCPRSSHAAVLLPDVDEQAFRKNAGLEIYDFGATDGVLHAVKLRDGHYALVSRDFDYTKQDGPYIIHTADNPAVTFAIWHASDMPMPCRMARSGRMVWYVPDIGKVYMFFNEKKEDMNFYPDRLENDGTVALISRFGGYPIVLEIEDNVPFSLNYFLTMNRLYQLGGDCGEGRGKFVRSFFGSRRNQAGETNESRWEREIDPQDVVSRIGLLAQDLKVPIRLVRQCDDSVYRFEGPFPV